MRSIPSVIVAATLACFASLAVPTVRADDLVVFAASSLKDSLTEVGAAWAAAGKARPVLSFAATSALARQIENGAPADLFISADEHWMDYLAGRALLASGTRTSLLGNELVLIAPATRPFPIDIRPGFALAARLEGEKLSMADVDSVPAGRYGKAALTRLGVWTSVEDSVVRQSDVRGALALVERDEARAGIVYRTDAMTSSNVVIAGVFPATTHDPIVYPLAIVAGRDSPEVRELREFLLSATASAIFRKHGFRVHHEP